jgi:hypothetical protein
MANRSSRDTSGGSKVSGRTQRDRGSSTHTTTFVDIPGVGSLRSSYDTDKRTGRISGQHMTKQK